MYTIDDSTGQFPFIRNWNWYMQTELNYIESFIHLSEDARKTLPIKKYKPKVFNSLGEIDKITYNTFTNIFGEDPTNSNIDYQATYNILLLRQSVFVTTISFFESKLEELCNRIYFDFLIHQKDNSEKESGEIKNGIDSYEEFQQEYKGSILNCRREYLEKIAKIEFDSTLKKQWSTFRTLYNIRNEIVHNFGSFKTFSIYHESLNKIPETLSGDKDFNRLTHYLKYILKFVEFHKTIELKNESGFNENTLFLKTDFFSKTLIPFYRNFITNLSNSLNKKITS